ncbi:MAG: hypothetical protein QXL15_04080 [Candidatus Korarchaeota archaeon]
MRDTYTIPNTSEKSRRQHLLEVFTIIRPKLNIQNLKRVFLSIIRNTVFWEFILFVIIACIVSIPYGSPFPIGGDAPFYIELIREISQGEVNILDLSPFDSRILYFIIWAPLGYVLSPLHVVFISQLTHTAILLLELQYIVKKIHPDERLRKLGLISIMLYTFLYSSFTHVANGLAMILIIPAILLLLRFREKDGNVKYLLSAVLFFILASISHYWSATLLSGIFFLYTMFTCVVEVGGWRERIKWLVAGIIPLVSNPIGILYYTIYYSPKTEEAKVALGFATTPQLYILFSFVFFVGNLLFLAVFYTALRLIKKWRSMNELQKFMLFLYFFHFPLFFYAVFINKLVEFSTLVGFERISMLTAISVIFIVPYAFEHQESETPSSENGSKEPNTESKLRTLIKQFYPELLTTVFVCTLLALFIITYPQIFMQIFTLRNLLPYSLVIPIIIPIIVTLYRKRKVADYQINESGFKLMTRSTSPWLRTIFVDCLSGLCICYLIDSLLSTFPMLGWFYDFYSLLYNGSHLLVRSIGFLFLTTILVRQKKHIICNELPPGRMIIGVILPCIVSVFDICLPSFFTILSANYFTGDLYTTLVNFYVSLAVIYYPNISKNLKALVVGVILGATTVIWSRYIINAIIYNATFIFPGWGIVEFFILLIGVCSGIALFKFVTNSPIKLRGNMDRKLFLIIICVLASAGYSSVWVRGHLHPEIYHGLKTVREKWDGPPPLFLYWGSVTWAHNIIPKERSLHADNWTRAIFGRHYLECERIENLVSGLSEAGGGNYTYMINDTPIVVIREFYYTPLPMPPLREYGIEQICENVYIVNGSVMSSHRRNWTIYVVPITDLLNTSGYGVAHVGVVDWNLNGYDVRYTMMFYTFSNYMVMFHTPCIKAGERINVEAHIEIRAITPFNVNFTILIGDETLIVSTDRSNTNNFHLTVGRDIRSITLLADAAIEEEGRSCEVDFTVYFKITFDS